MLHSPSPLVISSWSLWALFSFGSLHAPCWSSPVCVSQKKCLITFLSVSHLKFFFSSPSLPVLDLMSKLSKNRYVHHSTKCCIFSRSEASVIVRDMCLADGAISARMDSMTCESGIPRAAAHATVIPLGRWMEILPVTQSQASASAKQMSSVRVMQKFTVTSLSPSGIKTCVWFLNWRVEQISLLKTGWRKKKKKKKKTIWMKLTVSKWLN